MTLHEYQLYCMTNPVKDQDELNRRFYNQTRMIQDEIGKEREKEKMIKEITDEVMRRISIKINNEASPEIKKIMNDIDKLFTK